MSLRNLGHVIRRSSVAEVAGGGGVNGSRRPHDPRLPSHVSLLFILLFLPPQNNDRTNLLPTTANCCRSVARRRETQPGSVHLLPSLPSPTWTGQTGSNVQPVCLGKHAFVLNESAVFSRSRCCCRGSRSCCRRSACLVCLTLMWLH